MLALMPTAVLAGRRLLVAEDRPDLAFLYRAAFTRAGAEVELVAGGAAAVALWRLSERAGRPFDAVVLDFLMPEMRGTEAAARLRAGGYPGAVVGFTESADEAVFDLWLAAGCDAVVRKSDGVPVVIAAVAAAIACRSS